MAALKTIRPFRANVGTVVTPEGEAFALLRQVAFDDASPFSGRDAEEILAPTYGSGPPPVGTESFFYVDTDARKLYFRVTFAPASYKIVGDP